MVETSLNDRETEELDTILKYASRLLLAYVSFALINATITATVVTRKTHQMLSPRANQRLASDLALLQPSHLTNVHRCLCPTALYLRLWHNTDEERRRVQARRQNEREDAARRTRSRGDDDSSERRLR